MPKKRRGGQFGTRVVIDPTDFDVGKAFPDATQTPSKPPRGMPVYGREKVAPRNESVPKGPLVLGKEKIRIGRAKKTRWL